MVYAIRFHDLDGSRRWVCAGSGEREEFFTLTRAAKVVRRLNRQYGCQIYEVADIDGEARMNDSDLQTLIAARKAAKATARNVVIDECIQQLIGDGYSFNSNPCQILRELKAK
jgi:hypothetical protein